MKTLARCVAVATLVPLAGIAAPALAAVPVEERSVQRAPEPEPRAPRPRVEPADDGGEGLATFYHRLQSLEDDVRRLTGLVEELGWRIDRLAKEQRERYIEIDARLVDLRAPPGTEAATGTSDAASTPPPVVVEPGTEEAAYRTAFELVASVSDLSAQEQEAGYEIAIQRFTALIADYPNGRYTANAFYWLGELQLALNDLELSRQAFAQVVNLFPDHAKMRDALYKLGVVYHRLGDAGRALEFLDRVTADFPGSSAASLAQAYAAEIRAEAT